MSTLLSPQERRIYDHWRAACFNAMDGKWRATREIASRAGITLNAARHALHGLAASGQIEQQFRQRPGRSGVDLQPIYRRRTP